MRLGKLGYKHDKRTVRLADLLAPAVSVPAAYDFDRGRRPFPVSSWGNDAWGDCVIAGRANQALRMERIEHRRTLPLTPDQVVVEYQRLSGAKTPGDDADHGLVVLEAMREWRNTGWPIRTSSKASRIFKIDAYGELNKNDKAQLDAASFLLDGIQLGFALPLSAQLQTRQGTWDVAVGDGPEVQPGSWGGHLVYSKRYDSGGLFVLTWGQEIYVTGQFLLRYCDEAWAAVDGLESHGRHLDVQALEQHLHDIGATINP